MDPFRDRRKSHVCLWEELRPAPPHARCMHCHLQWPCLFEERAPGVCPGAEWGERAEAPMQQWRKELSPYRGGSLLSPQSEHTAARGLACPQLSPTVPCSQSANCVPQGGSDTVRDSLSRPLRNQDGPCSFAQSPSRSVFLIPGGDLSLLPSHPHGPARCWAPGLRSLAVSLGSLPECGVGWPGMAVACSMQVLSGPFPCHLPALSPVGNPCRALWHRWSGGASGRPIHQAQTGVIECRVTRSPGNKYSARNVLVNKLKNCKALKDFHAC